VARQIIGHSEYVFEFIDAAGYRKEEEKWHKPFTQLIKKSYQVTFDRKRFGSYGRVEQRERFEYDRNVWAY
jgi:hypothetical protein